MSRSQVPVRLDPELWKRVCDVAAARGMDVALVVAELVAKGLEACERR